uniref:HTH_48 domain-containing protein n=1 Tax=Rhodnius prolixus TaxID=13249 RepID=T1HFL5_RHOPR
MASLSEQRAALKFCFLLGKNAAESVLMLKTAYKDDAMGKTEVYEWFTRFKLATCRLMTNLVLDVHQLPESTKMLKKFESWCSQTVDRQLINCQRVVGYLGARFSEF